MRKYAILIFLFFMLLGIKAQNVQLHYDFGNLFYNNDLKERPVFTSTVEMFKSDKWGSTYFFVDMNYNSKGIDLAYWEISRELRFWKPPFSAHIEYNGGITSSGQMNNAYLGGITFTYNNKNFTKGFSFTPMYKYIQKHESPNNFQLTATWYIHFAKNGLCTFSGFADWWREKNPHGNFIFLSEPQFWVNLNKIKGIDEKFKLSIGSEVKISHNFAFQNGLYVIPTIAIKWSFD